jgi:hypothetical protein
LRRNPRFACHFAEANTSSFVRAPSAPTIQARIAFAIVIAVVAALLCYGNTLTPWGRPGDFGLSWFGAHSMLKGQDAYSQVGPGLTYDWPWPLLYPATSFIVALPFALLPQLWATLAFVFISSGLLAFSVTNDGWHRVPMFGSAAFIFAAGSAQWSPLFTAALTIPLLAVTFAAKPTIGLALAAAGSVRMQRYAFWGGLFSVVASLVLFPGWPGKWLATLRHAPHIVSPLFRIGGITILVVLLRWKRPEARLILALACVPQSGAWYEALPLFVVASTLYETMTLSVMSCIGFLLYYPRMDLTSDVQVNHDVGALIVAFVYLPAVIMVLRRPNESQRDALD